VGFGPPLSFLFAVVMTAVRLSGALSDFEVDTSRERLDRDVVWDWLQYDSPLSLLAVPRLNGDVEATRRIGARIETVPSWNAKLHRAGSVWPCMNSMARGTALGSS
jgi:hypothetical protein